MPRGVEHFLASQEEAHVFFLEPKSALNAGNKKNNKAVEDLKGV